MNIRNTAIAMILVLLCVSGAWAQDVVPQDAEEVSIGFDDALRYSDLSFHMNASTDSLYENGDYYTAGLNWYLDLPWRNQRLHTWLQAEDGAAWRTYQGRLCYQYTWAHKLATVDGRERRIDSGQIRTTLSFGGILQSRTYKGETWGRDLFHHTTLSSWYEATSFYYGPYIQVSRFVGNNPAKKLRNYNLVWTVQLLHPQRADLGFYAKWLPFVGGNTGFSIRTDFFGYLSYNYSIVDDQVVNRTVNQQGQVIDIRVDTRLL